MPGTAALRQLADPFEPVTALIASIRYLAELRSRFGNLGLAAAAYNAGEQRVENLLAGRGGSMPLETEDYVLKITGRPIADWKGAADETPKPLDKALPFAAACAKMVETRRDADRSGGGSCLGALGATPAVGRPGLRELLACPGGERLLQPAETPSGDFRRRAPAHRAGHQLQHGPTPPACSVRRRTEPRRG